MARSVFYLMRQKWSNKPSLSLGVRHGGAGEGIRNFLGLAVIFFLSACGQVESKVQAAMVPAQSRIESPRKLVVSTDEFTTKCDGVKKQGGLIVCKGPIGTKYFIDGKKIFSKNGVAYIGLDRDAPSSQMILVKQQNGTRAELMIPIEVRTYKIQRIDGLPPSQVSSFTKAQLARIRSSSARKKKGFSSREQTMWFQDGFSYPLKNFVKTSAFGPQRILNGVPKSPHYGVDIAAPVGTPIYAPAAGVVSLADDDLYFEGAMVLLDHGQGLISMYLHMNTIDVKPGQVIKRGEKLGEVGSKGRSTGPHLCWRLKWRNRHLDPELLTEWPDD